jgi:salicylate hydroxylase
MLPYLAQGAAQAIEDGYVLADILDRNRGDPSAGLQAYEAARLPRTARVQLHARERGKINNTTSRFARFRRDLGYRLKRLIKPKEHTYKIEWIYGHDVTAGRRETSAAA